MLSTTKEQVTQVIDGGTFRTVYQADVRLENVDTPESHEPGHLEAKEALRNLILQRDVEIHTKAHDSSGRRVAQVWRLPDCLNVNKEMTLYSR